jgi:hypothetical protein
VARSLHMKVGDLSSAGPLRDLPGPISGPGEDYASIVTMTALTPVPDYRNESSGSFSVVPS